MSETFLLMLIVVMIIGVVTIHQELFLNVWIELFNLILGMLIEKKNNHLN